MTRTSTDYLIDICNSANQNAWPSFVKRFGGRLEYWIRQYGITPTDMNDAIQETLFKIWRCAKSFDRDRGRARVFVHNITRSCAYDLLRSLRRHGHAKELTEEMVIQQLNSLLDEESYQWRTDLALEKAKLRVSESDYEVFVLLVLKGLTLPEVAKLQNKSMGAVSQAKHRAVKVVREELTLIGEEER